MQLFILMVVIVTIFNVVVFRRGLAQNRKLILDTCTIVESVFEPIDTLYTNIGGVVGYNMHYALNSPFISLDGVVTTSPRHTMFYLPISRLIGRTDSLILSISVEFLQAGEAHIVALNPFQKGRIQLDDIEQMRQTTIHDRRFAILSYNDIQEARMRELFDSLSDPSGLVHIGFYGSSRCFSVVADPTTPAIQTLLTDIRDGLRAQNKRTT